MAIIPKELREKVQESGDMFTRSPHVNYLIKACQDVKDGKADRESLRDPLNKLYATYDALIITYKSLSPTQPRDEDFSIKTKVFLASCEAFRCALDEITLYFRDNDTNHIDLGLKLLKKETESVMGLIDEFKRHEEKAQKFSNSPPISELIRIGKGVISGEFKPELLKPRLEIIRNIYEYTAGHVKEMTQKEPDTKVLEEQIPVILEALALFKYGIENIDSYFANIEHAGSGEINSDEKSGSSDDFFGDFNDEKPVSSGDSFGDFGGFGDEKPVSSGDSFGDFGGFGSEKSGSHDDSSEDSGFGGFGSEKFGSHDDSSENSEFGGFEDEKPAAVSSEDSGKSVEKKDKAISLLKKGLDNIEEASHEIYRAQMALKAEIDRAHRGPVRLCPRCSNEVTADLKFCPECRAILPQIHSAHSRLDIKDSTIQEQRQFMVPPHVKKVYTAAWDVSKGKITKDEFEKTLDWFENNIEVNSINMDELLTVPEGITKEEKTLFESIKQNIEEGIQECRAGIEDMRMYLLDDDILNLETGLGKLMKGGDLLYGVKHLGDKVSRAGKKNK